MGKFKRGLMLGGLLGVALTWLNTSKKGKAMRDEMIDHAAEVYNQVKEKIAASGVWEGMTENKYLAMVQDAIDKYAVQTGLSDKVKRMVTKLVNMQWRTLEKEIKNGKKK